jgi:hypothetical protein
MLVNISLALQVACTFKLAIAFLLTYSSPCVEGFKIRTCVQSKAPIAAEKWYRFCHCYFTSLIESFVDGNFIHSLEFSRILIMTSDIVFETVL